LLSAEIHADRAGRFGDAEPATIEVAERAVFVA